MKIAILDDYQHVIQTLNCFDQIKKEDVLILHKTEKDIDKLVPLLRDKEILVLTRERTEISEALLQNLPNLKLISQTGKISNHLDLAACTKHGVAVSEGVGSPTAPAELTWILIMNVLRQVPQAIDEMKKGNWQTNIGTSVHGKIIGIWGYGKIGKLISKYAKAFGAEVQIWGSEKSRDEATKDGFKASSSKEDFFKSSDVLSLHLRLTETTREIVKRSDLALMKSSAAFINTSRAELIESGALLKALQSGKPGFAGIDVYENEPVYDSNFEFLRLKNVICTPHLGYVEENGYELYFGKAFENVMQFIKGTPSNIANPEVLKK